MKNKTPKTYYIYKLVNDCEPGKVYIGQTTDIKHRFQVCQYRGKKIADAIKKFGWENFHVNLLATVDTETEANALEFFYINEYDSVNNGYNSTYKTRENRCPTKSKERNAKASATMHTSRWYYNPKTDETIRIMKGGLVPNGFVLGRGGKMKSVRGHQLWLNVSERASERPVAEIA